MLLLFQRDYDTCETTRENEEMVSQNFNEICGDMGRVVEVMTSLGLNSPIYTAMEKVFENSEISDFTFLMLKTQECNGRTIET